MRLADPKVWLAVFSLALVGTLIALSWERTSPGPLSAVHAGVPRLSGKGGCEACHGGLLRSMDSACLDCHRDVGAQLEAGTGLHGSLRERGRCSRCHQEHLGDDAALAGPATFALAGLGAREDFAHAHVPFALTGRHGELACAACHPHADAQPLASGQKRFLGLDQRCTSCHEDPHQGRFARGCETCHGQERPFGELASFTHGAAFPLAGAHGKPACLDCHPKDGPYAVESLAGKDAPPPARSCEDCHASPHGASFTAGVAAATALAAGSTCASCHPAEEGGFHGLAEMPPALHAASGFSLEPPHERAGCLACHPPAGVGFSARFPGRQASDCAACHDDPHGGQFQRGALAVQVAREGCLTCHAPHAFEPPRFDADSHSATSFPLEGRHRQVDCAQCHLPPSPGEPRSFTGTAAACSACHADVHEGLLAAPAREQGCGACHLPSAFAEVDRAAFDHGAWTRFPLLGAHAAAGCAACHPALAASGPGERTTARASDRFGGPPWGCASCHDDVHRGAFGGEDCAGCHVPVSFAHVEPPFDHGRATGFALTGAHGRIACSACHGGGVVEAGKRRALGFARPRGPLESCASCHADPHGGRFDRGGLPAAVEGRSGCERCHSTDSFRAVEPAGFDHGLWTGHVLEGVHARAACTSCHAPAAGGGLGAVRGTGCADCHADPHAGQFAARGVPGDCGRCHSGAAAIFAPDRFDHDRDARFPLDKIHRALDCSACHLPWPLSSGGMVVRYRPLGTACADCHGPGKGGGQRR